MGLRHKNYCHYAEGRERKRHAIKCSTDCGQLHVIGARFHTPPSSEYRGAEGRLYNSKVTPVVRVLSS